MKELIFLLKNVKCDTEYVKIAKGKYKYPNNWEDLWKKFKML